MINSGNCLKEKYILLQRVKLIMIGYLDLVFFYKELVLKIRDKLMSSKNRLSNGLNKLFEANSTIASLKTKLIDL